MLAFERIHHGLLQFGIDGQVKILPGVRLLAPDHAQHAALGIDLDVFHAHLPVQARFVETLDAGLADMRGAAVARGVNAFQISRIDSSHIADHMREQLAERVTPVQIRHHFHARETMPVHGEARHLDLAQAQLDRHRLEAAPRARRGQEALGILVRQLDHLTQSRDHVVQVLDILAHCVQPVGRHVVGQQAAVAVVDQPARRHDRPRLDAVGLRAGVEFVETGDLQPGKARAQHHERQHHQHERHHRPAPLRRGLKQRIAHRLARRSFHGSGRRVFMIRRGCADAGGCHPAARTARARSAPRSRAPPRTPSRAYPRRSGPGSSAPRCGR